MAIDRIWFPLAVAGLAAAVGAVVALIFCTLVDFRAAQTPKTAAVAQKKPAGVVYQPPKPQQAPKSIRDAVMLGYHIMTATGKYAAAYVGNKLTCSNCHFQAGITRGAKRGGLSLVGVAAKYPAYRPRQQYATDLVLRTNNCFERSMNGKPLPPDSKEMQGIMAYYHWISKGLPIYGHIPWLGLVPLTSTHPGNQVQGKQDYGQKCAACHGAGGQGTAMAPPLWGPESYNDGAGMSKPKKLAAFAYLNMPKGNPNLTQVQALDIAAYVDRQPRPHFKGAP